MRPIYVKMEHLSSNDGECFVWPLPAGRGPEYLFAAAREHLSMCGVDVGPGDDCVVEAPALFGWMKAWRDTGIIRQHSGFEHIDAVGCGCEGEGWYCPEGDGAIEYQGWTSADCDHPEDLPMRML